MIARRAAVISVPLGRLELALGSLRTFRAKVRAQRKPVGIAPHGRGTGAAAMVRDVVTPASAAGAAVPAVTSIDGAAVPVVTSIDGAAMPAAAGRSTAAGSQGQAVDPSPPSSAMGVDSDGGEEEEEEAVAVNDAVTAVLRGGPTAIDGAEEAGTRAPAPPASSTALQSAPAAGASTVAGEAALVPRSTARFAPTSTTESAIGVPRYPVDERYAPAPTSRAWACCGSVVPPEELELWEVVYGEVHAPCSEQDSALPWCVALLPGDAFRGTAAPGAAPAAGAESRDYERTQVAPPEPRGADGADPRPSDAELAGHPVSGSFGGRHDLRSRLRLAADPCQPCLTRCCTAQSCRRGEGCCGCACSRRSAVWPPGFMTVVGVVVATPSAVLPPLRYENVPAITAPGGSLLMALFYAFAVAYDYLRREEGRRRLDGGTLLGAAVFIEVITGGASAVLEVVLRLRGNGLVFLGLVYGYMAAASVLVAAWQKAAPATAATQNQRQPFVFVLELTVSMFTVLTFVLSQRLDSAGFWLALFAKFSAILVLQTQLHKDIRRWFSTGRITLRFDTASQGEEQLTRAERSLFAEQVAATVCAVALLAEELALTIGIADRPVLTPILPGGGRNPWDSVSASLVTFVALSLAAVPVSQVILRRKIATSRLRKAMHVVMGLVVMKRSTARRALVKSKTSLDLLAAWGDPAHQNTRAGHERVLELHDRIEKGLVDAPLPETDRPRLTKASHPHFLKTHWREFNAMIVFAIISAVNGSFVVAFASF